ncbi:MAG: 16S/23S rRNA (cytidine-2'-O)-methyltransferase TlyA [Myxococcales bacterium]
MTRRRLDQLLVERGLAETRERAQGLIRAGEVRVDERLVDKPGTPIKESAVIRVLRDPCPYVSRGGLKLAGALDHFGVDPTGRTALDVGASTGGFTDCLLQRGAARVIAIDVGSNQLDWRIRSDPRVQVHERLNFRLLPESPLHAAIAAAGADLAVVDVSFISLRLILPVLGTVLRRPADVIALVKPQFEVGHAEVGKGGIVRDPAARERALAGIVALCGGHLGWPVAGTMESPITGTKGNVEFLLHARPR